MSSSSPPLSSSSLTNSPSAYPFPPYDASRRQTSRSRDRPRRASTTSTASVPSVGGSLDIAPRRASTVRETNHNAISTLLQPPIVRTGLLPHTAASAAASGFKAPTTRDIPPVALTNIPHVAPDRFRDYLTRIGPLLESLQRGKAEPGRPSWLEKEGRDLEKTDRSAEVLDGRLSRDGSTTPSSPISSAASALSPPETPSLPRRKSSMPYRRNRHEPTPLSIIPTVYFEEDFHLENPRTFDVVSERADILRPPPGTPQVESKGANGASLPPRKALATNAILQEKLSWYMDTVEVHLINRISTASTGFFTALGSLKELQTEAAESVAKIQSLRADLRRLDEEVAIGGRDIAAKRRRRANLQKLRQATAQVQRVVENVEKADELVEEGSFDDAADQMDRVGRLLCGKAEPGSEDDQLIDLRPLKALQGLDSGLQELQLRIGTGFAHRFTSILIEDLRQHTEKVPAADTLKRWSRQRGIQPIYLEINDSFRKDLQASLGGLARAGHTAPATAAYREAVQKEMKHLIRKHLPSSSDGDAESMVSTSTRGGSKLSQQEKSTILARNLRALDAEDAEKLLIDIYTSVGEALRRVSTQTKILLDVTSSMHPLGGPQTSPESPGWPSVGGRLTNGTPATTPGANAEEDMSQALDMSSLLEQAVDTAQIQITRVLKVRNEQSVRLSKERFLRYFTLNRLFADECEAVSGRSGQALKGIINAQISGFVQVLGTSETERVANLLDGDTWNADDFTDADNTLLQRILGSMGSDPPEWTKGSPIWEGASASADAPLTNGETKASAMAATQGAPASKAAAKPAYVDERRYILVRSTASLLPSIDSFLSLTASMPSMTPQISTSLLEVLRTFNSRSCQLILGAGALRSAGLKNITTKHLSLASQALSFIIALVPYMRECIRRHLPSGHANVLAEFDKTKRLYQDHQAGIHDKLVDMMTSRSQGHVRALSAIDFQATPSPDHDSTNANKSSPYMETLTKETLTLHRVLTRHLNDVDVDMIMRQIFAAYREQWTAAFREAAAAVTDASARRLLLRDAECFDARLGKIEGWGEIGREVIAVVKEKVDSGATAGRTEDEKAGKGKSGDERKVGKEEKEEAKGRNGGQVEATKG